MLILTWIKLTAFCSLASGQAENKKARANYDDKVLVGGPWTNVSFDFNIIDARHLKGARWELEQKNKEAINVYFAMEILDLSRISPTNGEFRLDFNLKQTWKAPQLILPKNLFWANESGDTFVTVDGGVLADLWTPDAYIPNSRDAAIEVLTFPQKAVSIFKNGTIMYTSNMYTVNGCAMEFHWYPLETLHCNFLLESYSYTDKNVKFHWDPTLIQREPVYFPGQHRLRQYVLEKPFKIGVRSVHRFGRADAYSRLFVVFVLRRPVGHFILQTFMPTFFIVSLSWFSFWLGMDAIPGRVSLLVTCMLTLVTLYSGQKVDLPPVSYVKMMDVWMTACLAFVFAAMAEFIVVRYMAKNDCPKDEKMMGKLPSLLPYYNEFYQKKTQNQSIHDELRLLEHRMARGPGTVSSWNPPMYDEYYPPHTTVQIQTRNVESRVVRRHSNSARLERKDSENASDENEAGNQKLWRRIDRASRAAFPLLFLCFCIIFWPILIYGDPRASSSEDETH